MARWGNPHPTREAAEAMAARLQARAVEDERYVAVPWRDPVEGVQHYNVTTRRRPRRR
ncbi:MAG: hypothetical protein K6U87_09255 [Firmicutes bacterium]|nr:hypothetical protein [Bacillota bacterium]